MYEAGEMKVTHVVRDPYLGKTRDVDAEEAARYEHVDVRKDVRFELMFDDPMSAALFLAHVRKVLQQPDLEDVEAELGVTLVNLGRTQIEALESLIELSWASIGSRVIAERHMYELAPEHAGALS